MGGKVRDVGKVERGERKIGRNIYIYYRNFCV